MRTYCYYYKYLPGKLKILNSHKKIIIIISNIFFILYNNNNNNLFTCDNFEKRSNKKNMRIYIYMI